VQYGSYCLSGWLHFNYPVGLWIIKMSQITSPSKTMAISDGRWVDTWASNLLDPETPGDYSFTWRIGVKRHSDGVNMVFMGGNVSWIPVRGLAVADKSKRRVIYNPVTGD
jgi:prepilin-type processing-associated H-X9-DG protein